MFKRDKITVGPMDSVELENLIRFLDYGVIGNFSYYVKARKASPSLETVVYFMTVPRSWFKELPMETAIALVLSGEYKVD